ncbi:MAG: zinc ribbon domain-containing protein [Gemmatimonadota bacterium]|nr:zinc ribbon domain-containing protein [Gemmatimonadota bacterium]
MDDLDRLFQRLVHNIRNGHAEYLSVPFTVQELYDTLVPYRHYRRDLGIETNQDYEAALTRLLAGENGYIRADQSMQDRLKKELGSQHPDLGAFRDYAETRISLVPAAVQKLGVSIPSQNAGGYSVGAHGAGANGGNGSTDSTTFSVPALSTMEMPDGCRFCGGTLPQSRPVTYCPHCGQNLAAKHCEGCGAELDPVWKFCVNCGKKA